MIAQSASLAREPIGPAAADYDTFLKTLGDRDRLNVIGHMAFCEAESDPGHARLWKRLACVMASFAPHATQTTGRRAVRFFAKDGIYRRQVFALEDPRDGSLFVYVADVLAQAVASGILAAPAGADDNDGDQVTYEIRGGSGETLTVEPLTAAQTATAPEFYKHMLGWNRTAVRITLPTSAGPAHLRAIEALCALTARPAARPAAGGATLS